MLVVAQIISYLTILTRRQAESSRLIQQQTTALYTLSRQLTNIRGVDNLVAFGTRYIATVFNCDVMTLLPKKGQLEVQCCYELKQRLDAKERSIAQWVFEMGQTAGLGTDTLSFSHALYVPLTVAQASIGVLRLQPKTLQLFTPEQRDLLESCVRQMALALDVDRQQENTRKKELVTKTNRARITLLEVISNDLHTPLNIIISAATALKTINDERASKIGKDIDSEIEKLRQLNNNIMRIIQLEFQDIKFKKTLNSMKEIIDLVIKNSSLALKERTIHTHIPKNTPLVPMNKELIQEVLINIVDNAVKFTPPKSPITITVYVEPGRVLVSIEDAGPGVALDEQDKLFEKFYRGKQLMTVHGLGLGLAICHQIIDAHGGSIWVENIEHKGAAFRFTLPLNID